MVAQQFAGDLKLFIKVYFIHGYSSAHHTALLALTAAAVVGTTLILWSFITPISWAVALAILVHPVYRTLRLAGIHSSVAAGIMTFGLGVCVVIPIAWVVHSLFSAAIAGIETIVPTSLPDMWDTLIRRYPWMADAARSVRQVIQLPDALSQATQRFSVQAELLLRGSIRLMVDATLMLFIVFFLMRDSGILLKGVRDLLPINDTDVSEIFARISDTIHAALFGIVAVAVVQGFLGALLLWWLKLPGAVVWGTIMALLALVPYLGAFIVWIPVAIFLVLQGEWDQAVITSVWGAVVIGLSDNLLYPFLVGKRLHYHSLIVFFFLLGGVVVFGVAGVVLGPAILAISDRLLWIWRREPEPREAS